MGFLSAIGGALKGGIGGFISSGGNPWAAGAGALIGGVGGIKGKKKKKGGPAGIDPAQARIDEDRNRYLDMLKGGQGALETSTRAAVTNAMPAFDQRLQSMRESNTRRGVANGELATQGEGTLASAFQNNISNAIAGQAQGMYGSQLGGARDLYQTGLDVQSGDRDRAQAERNANSQRKSSIWGSLLGAAGTAGGAWLANRGGVKRRSAGFAGNV